MRVHGETRLRLVRESRARVQGQSKEIKEHTMPSQANLITLLAACLDQIDDCNHMISTLTGNTHVQA